MFHKNGWSRYAKDVKETDELLTKGNEFVPVIAVSRAFGKTTITYGDDISPKQKTFTDWNTVVINEKVWRKHTKETQ